MAKLHPELEAQLTARTTEEQKEAYFRQRYGDHAYHEQFRNYYYEAFLDDSMKSLLEPHFKEIGNLPNITCRVHGHCVMIHDENPVIGHQKETQSNSDGLYMYHYLFACFQNRKKEMARKVPEDQRKYVMDQLRKQIRVEEQKLTELKNRLSHHEHYQDLKEKSKDCPFHRKKATTYHETRALKKPKISKNSKKPEVPFATISSPLPK